MSLADDGIMARPAARTDVEPQVDGPSRSEPSEPHRRTVAPLAKASTELATSDFAVAITALHRGVTEIEDLHDRCARLRSELSDAEDRQRARLLALRDEILHWQDLVSDLADQYQTHQDQLQDLRLQHGATRETAAREQRRAETAERRLLSFERLVLSIHDQILSAVVKDRSDTSDLASNT